jgi:hypothetical protein
MGPPRRKNRKRKNDTPNSDEFDSKRPRKGAAQPPYGDEEKKEDETSTTQTSQRAMVKPRWALPEKRNITTSTSGTGNQSRKPKNSKLEHDENEPLLVVDLHMGTQITEHQTIRLRIDAIEVKPRRNQELMAKLGMNDITGRYIEGHAVTRNAIAQVRNLHPSSDIEIKKFLVKPISSHWKNSIADISVHFTEKTEISVHAGLIAPYMPPAATVVDAMELNEIKDLDAVLCSWERGETGNGDRYVTARLILFGANDSRPSRVDMIGWRDPSDRVPQQICAIRINNVLTSEYNEMFQLRMTSCTTIVQKDIDDPLAQEMLQYFDLV